jgi:hypothetical protein
MLSGRRLCSISLELLWVVILLLAPLSVDAKPTLIGDSVAASISSIQVSVIKKQFTSPAIVDGGVEFAGKMIDPFGQIWDIFVDVGASDFTISWTEETHPDIATMFTTPALRLSLSGLDLHPTTPIAGVINSAYSCSPASYFACSPTGVYGPPPNISALTFTADTIDVSFNTLRNGERYTFIIVPEISAGLMLAVGVIGLLGCEWRKRPPGHLT